MRGFTFVLAVSVVAPLSILSAQQPPLEPGTRVRVTAPACGIERFATAIQGLHEDTLELLGNQAGRSSSNTRCMLSSVTDFEVHRGTSSRLALGLGVGFLAGAGLGALAGAGWECKIPDADGNRAMCVSIGAGIGAATGLLLGGVIGAVNRADHWEEVPLDRLRVSFAPQRDRVSFGLRIAF